MRVRPEVWSREFNGNRTGPSWALYVLALFLALLLAPTALAVDEVAWDAFLDQLDAVDDLFVDLESDYVEIDLGTGDFMIEGTMSSEAFIHNRELKVILDSPRGTWTTFVTVTKCDRYMIYDAQGGGGPGTIEYFDFDYYTDRFRLWGNAPIDTPIDDWLDPEVQTVKAGLVLSTAPPGLVLEEPDNAEVFSMGDAHLCSRSGDDVTLATPETPPGAGTRTKNACLPPIPVVITQAEFDTISAPGELLVAFKVLDGSVEQTLADAGAWGVETFPELAVMRAGATPGAEVLVMESLMAHPNVVAVSPQYWFQPAGTPPPGDGYWGSQWHLLDPDLGEEYGIAALEAWAVTTGNLQTRVAFVDTGILKTHNDLAPHVAGTGHWDVVNEHSMPVDTWLEGHGTGIAGLACAVTDHGMPPGPLSGAGISTSLIVDIKALTDDGAGGGGYKAVDVLKSIRRAANMTEGNADIVNLSIEVFPAGGRPGEGFKRSWIVPLRRALRNAQDTNNSPRPIFLASAGNRGTKGLAYPARLARVAAVGGNDEAGNRWPLTEDCVGEVDQGSSFGSGMDFLAPFAVNIVVDPFIDCSWPDLNLWTASNTGIGDYRRFAGTSASAAIASGLAALMHESDPAFYQDNPIALRNEMGRGVLPRGSGPAHDKQTGAGIVNGRRSVLAPPKAAPSPSVATQILVTRGRGKKSNIRRYDMTGALQGEFQAYGPNYEKGIFIATGNLDGDPEWEIVVGRDRGGMSKINIFDVDGSPWPLLPEIAGVFSKKRGVRVAVGNLGGSPMIIAAEGPGRNAGPRVDMYSLDSSCMGMLLVDDFDVFDSSHRHGAHVAAVDVDGDSFDEIVLGSGHGDPDLVEVWAFGGTACAPGALTRLGSFNPWVNAVPYNYDADLDGDNWVAGGELDGNPGEEIVVGGGELTGPEISVWYYKDGIQVFTRSERFLAQHPMFWDGATVAVGNLDADSTLEIVTGRHRGGPGHVRAFELTGWTFDMEFNAWNASYRGVNRVAVGVFP